MLGGKAISGEVFRAFEEEAKASSSLFFRLGAAGSKCDSDAAGLRFLM
jgi:hypothetical protein